MKALIFLLPILLGTFTVMQGGLNRILASEYGLSVATLNNACALIFLGVAFFFAVRFFPQCFPHFFQATDKSFQFKMWYIVPGFLGISLVIGMPWIISKVGSTQLFIGMICGQLIGSLVWDAIVEGISFSFVRLAGVVCAFLGVLLAQSR